MSKSSIKDEDEDFYNDSDFEGNNTIPEKNKNNTNIIKYNSRICNINDKIMKDFLLSLKNEDIIKSFKENGPKYKLISNLKGYYFCIFNKNILSLKKKENGYDPPIKRLNSIYNLVTGDKNSNERKLDKYLWELNDKIRDKIDYCRNIFNRLKKLEIKIQKSNGYIKNRNKNYSPNLIKLCIRICLNYLSKKKLIEEREYSIKKNKNEIIENKIKNITTLIEELEILNEKINNYEIDIFSIEIYEDENNIFTKILNIVSNKLLNFVKKIEKIKRENIKLCFYRWKNYIKINSFLIDNYKKITKGQNIKKIRNKKKELSENFYYKIDEGNNNLVVKSDKKERNSLHQYNLDTTIIKFMYGISSPNLIKKSMSESSGNNNLEQIMKIPGKFFSIITNKKSIDLYFEEEKDLDTWFYGLKYFYSNNQKENAKYKMISTRKFILNKLKFKIVQRLKKKFVNEDSEFIERLTKEKAIQNYSFTKIFL